MRCHVLHARSSYAVAVSGMKPPGCRSPLPVRGQAAASRGRARPPEVPDRRSAPSGKTPRGKSSPRPPPVPAPERGSRGLVRPARRCSAVGQHRRRLGVGCGHRLSFLRRGAGPFSARILRGRRRVSAPARFARLIARARQRAHLSRRLLTGFQKWRRPAAQRRGKRLRSPLPWGPSYHNPPDVKPILRTKVKNIGNCSYFSKAGKGVYCGPASRPSSSRRPRPPRMRAAARSIWRFARK